VRQPSRLLRRCLHRSWPNCTKSIIRTRWLRRMSSSWLELWLIFRITQFSTLFLCPKFMSRSINSYTH